jgi:hypothetical protein
MKIGNAADRLLHYTALVSCLTLANACTQKQDVGRFKGAGKDGFCEAKFGTYLSKQTPYVTRALEGAEDIAGSKWQAALCNGTVPAELFVDSKGALESIQFSGSGQCLGGICIGQRFDETVADPTSWKIFMTAEEGGILTARRDEAITYVFGTAGIPLDCFAAQDRCGPQTNGARITGIVVRSAK